MNEPKDVHHIVDYKILLKSGAALFALTFLTMIAFWNHHHLGAFAAPIAFLIAGVKAAIVMMFFMGLKYDSTMNRIIFGLGFFFLAVLMAFSALDIWTRVPVLGTI
ncbi:MAG: cytochrome C oxidase subunit IV family protein [Bdellovibrionaceae bacterium]|nr:cytochrome C oxidase subunit IV family protein [Pseudobdellovibrionaceae bacterium]MBX3034534.1 cytochrome C oxidase subunit IV family protein [Pseudobdellovibrionaceae bacterium]